MTGKKNMFIVTAIRHAETAKQKVLIAASKVSKLNTL